MRESNGKGRKRGKEKGRGWENKIWEKKGRKRQEKEKRKGNIGKKRGNMGKESEGR